MNKTFNPARSLYLLVRNEIMARGGLQPRGDYRWSKGQKVFRPGDEPSLKVPNLVGSFNEVLRCFWDHHGLGSRSLLVSESVRTSDVMHRHYPETEFLTCDLFSELMGEQQADRPHFVWDVCTQPPRDLIPSSFDSVVSHALLEHVIAPTTAIKNFLMLLRAGGKLYFMTHTPSFHKHQYPRDYVRFHHDYFEDLPNYLMKEYCISSELTELYSAKGVICGVYLRNP
jgi:SAM-dependent methyltransferase